MMAFGRGLLLGLLGILLSGSAWAGHRHGYVHFGVVVNPWMAPPPYYYQYPPVYYPQQIVVQPAPVVVQQPPVYIEQSAPAVAAPAPIYWYYCRAAKAYYPYAKECRGGWERVLPQPQQ